MRNLVQDGQIVTVTAPAVVTPGALVAIGSLIGVAVTGAASGDPVPIRLEGVFSGLPTTGTGFNVGAPVYYDAGEAALSTSDGTGANPRVGIVVGSGLIRLG